MKRLIRYLALMFGLAGMSQAHAGIPVIDGANLAQAIQQVLAWSQQYDQMVQSIQTLHAQYAQLENTFNVMTGNRGLGTLLNTIADQATRRYLPEAGTQIDQLASGEVPGYSDLQSTVASIRSTISSMPAGSLPANALAALNSQLNALATHKALGQAAYSSAEQRFSDTENLIATIGTADDPKAIAEMNARLTAQQALVANEATKVQALAYMQRVSELEQQQVGNEAIAKWGKSTLPDITF
jgi:type IV secretion system protein VirB5